LKKYEKYTKWIIIFVLGAALIAVYKTFDNITNVLSFFGNIFASLTPFIAGFIIAYILNLPSKKLEKLYLKTKSKFVKKRAKILSILTVYLCLVLIVSFIIRLVIPNLYNNIIDLYNNIIPFTQNAIAQIENLQKSWGIVFFEINEETVRATIQKILNSVNVAEFGKYAKGAITFTSGLFKTLIALIVSIYMLVDRDSIFKSADRVLKALLPRDKVSAVYKYMKRVDGIFSDYVYSCVLDAAIVAFLASIILSLIGVKYALIFGIFIGVCNLIPYFGSIISNVLTVIITIFTSGWVKALWTAVSLLLLGQVDGNIIGPKIMGSKLETRPLLIIFAVTLGGGLFGVAGMVLSVPVVMVIRMIFKEILLNIESKKNKTE